MTNLHKNACDESTVAKLLLTEDSIKKFLREFYTNSFRGITLVTLILLLQQPRPQQKDTQGSRLVASSIVLSWNTFQNLPSNQWCYKLNPGGLLENSNVENSLEILSKVKKNNASAFRASV